MCLVFCAGCARLVPGLPNIELSSAADHAQHLRFLTGPHSRFKTGPEATAPTICYVQPDFAGP